MKGLPALIACLITIAVGISPLKTYRFQQATLEIDRRSGVLAEWNARKDYQASCLKLKDEAVPLSNDCLKTFQRGWLGPPPPEKIREVLISKKIDSRSEKGEEAQYVAYNAEFWESLRPFSSAPSPDSFEYLLSSWSPGYDPDRSIEDRFIEAYEVCLQPYLPRPPEPARSVFWMILRFWSVLYIAGHDITGGFWNYANAIFGLRGIRGQYLHGTISAVAFAYTIFCWKDRYY